MRGQETVGYKVCSDCCENVVDKRMGAKWAGCCWVLL